MNLGLKGKLALVTGSTRGLGRAIAEALAQEGADIIINGRNEKMVLETIKEISDKYRVQAWACPVDATDTKAIKIFFELGPVAAMGKLDILINNAGNRKKFGNLTTLDDEDWLRSYNLVFMSMVRFTREAMPYLERSGCGRIINISSLSSHQPGNFNPHYSTAKAAMNNLTKYLANTLASKNILVNAICPNTLRGGGWTENVQDRAKRDGLTFAEAELKMTQEEIKKSPLGRMGTLEDVAHLVTFLASDNAKFLTGHIYDADGGTAKGI